jgi:hypothetical protein
MSWLLPYVGSPDYLDVLLANGDQTGAVQRGRQELVGGSNSRHAATPPPRHLPAHCP